MCDVTKEIKSLAEKAEKTSDSGDAMRLSQSALNLAHVQATLENIKK